MSCELSADTLKAAAAFFGIEVSEGQNGHPQWAVKIDTRQTQDLCPTQTAIFDQSSKQWILSKRALSDPSPQISNKRPSVERLNHDLPRMGLQSHSWTKHLQDTEHVRKFRSVDWSSGPIGELNSWPLCLRLYTHMIFSMNYPAVVYWGPQRVAIYNETFKPMFSGGQEGSLGEALRVDFPVPKFERILQQVEISGKGFTQPEFNIFIPHENYVEEAWWAGHVSPLVDDDGSIRGLLCEFEEKTKEVLLVRRTSMINDIGHPPQKIPNRAIWDHILSVLIKFPKDIAMAMLYSSETNQHQQHTVALQSTIGIRTNHLAAPDVLDLSSDTHGFARAMRVALDSGDQWTNLKSVDHFSHDILDGIDWQGYREMSRSIVIIPIVVLDDLLKGFLILGLNPRLEFDAPHRQFVSDLRRQLVSTFTSDFSRKAALEREGRLSLQLAESERRVRRMAELAPVGMYELSAQGPLKWANEHFFEILGCTRPKDLNDFAWQDWLLAEDTMTAMAGLIKGIAEVTDVSGPLRLNRKWRPPRPPGGGNEVEDEEHAWILYQAYPHVEEGRVVSLMGCLTDISQFKWAESVQARSAEAARVAKQRQEDFIDITSHEMRNPLSAIQQCADSIASSWREHQETSGGTEDLIQRIKSNVEAAESILLCAMHQRRIIDDVLTLSKIDSAMLSVVPVSFEPESIIGDAMQMFLAEFTSSDIDVKTSYDKGVLRPGELVMCDPARLMQVLVNLLTNAIKFTRPRDHRLIQISGGCTASPPATTHFGENFAWSSSGKARPDLTSLPEYGQGDVLYLYFAVTDTGQGLPSHQAVRIFDKFVQASRRTHIKYGGSGLGLFISRELTEVQGGQIGVASEESVGSTFTFYVKARRSSEQGRSKSPTRMLDIKPFPRKSSLHDQSHLQSEYRAPALPTTNPNQAKASKRYSILMVEDNLLNQKVLAKQMRKVGCEVYVANHGGEAIDFVLRASGQSPEYDTASKNSTTTTSSSASSSTAILPTSKSSVINPNLTPNPLNISPQQSQCPAQQPQPPIDCILMDWEMPICDGLTATRRIRDLENHDPPILRQRRHLIIGVTANARREQIAVAKEAGMDAVVVKPFSVKELMDKIEEQVARAAETKGNL